MNTEPIYNQVLSQYYGINCDKCEIKDTFWLDYANLKIKFDTQCLTFLQILFQ